MPARLTNEERLRRSITEVQQSKVFEDYFDLTGWWWHHETDSRKSRQGMPDLNAWHPSTGWSAHLEIKRERGVLSIEQYEALRAMSWWSLPGPFDPQMDFFHWVGGPRRIVAVVRPRNADRVLAMLKQTFE